MNLNQLKCFIELAQSEHLTKTAMKANYTVPALSNIISSLEKELGVNLFDRVGRNIKLNEFGKVFYKYVKESLESLDEGISKIRENDSDGKKTVYIASADRIFWLDVFDAFINNNPSVFISRVSIDLFALRESSLIEKFDFILCAEDNLTDPSWDHINLVQTEPIILLSRDHPMIGRENVSLSEIKDEHFIVMPKGHSTRKYFDDICSFEHISVTNTTESDVMIRNIQLGKDSNTVSLSTTYAYNCMDISYVPYLYLQTDFPKRNMALFWKKNKSLPNSAMILKDFFVQYFEHYSYDKK